jgi:hypothetical protein
MNDQDGKGRTADNFWYNPKLFGLSQGWFGVVFLLVVLSILAILEIFFGISPSR